MKKAVSVNVVQDEDSPVSKEVLAKSIADISSAFRHLRISGLNRKAIVILVAHSTKLGQNTVDAVIDAVEQLKRDYCN